MLAILVQMPCAKEKGDCLQPVARTFTMGSGMMICPMAKELCTLKRVCTTVVSLMVRERVRVVFNMRQAERYTKVSLNRTNRMVKAVILSQKILCMRTFKLSPEFLYWSAAFPKSGASLKRSRAKTNAN